MPGPWQTRAKLLFGDALFKQGEYKRAKEIYIVVRKGTTGDDKAAATKKIVACNAALGLNDRDGITGP